MCVSVGNKLIIIIFTSIKMLIICYFCRARDWPKEAILVPGNEVIFSLETATDYLHDYNKSDG